MIFETTGDDFASLGITGFLASLKSAKGPKGGLAGLSPEDGMKVGEDGFPVGRGNAGFGVAQQVYDAELVSDAP